MPWKNKEDALAYFKKKYHTDPEYRERHKRDVREWQKKNRHKYKPERIKQKAQLKQEVLTHYGNDNCSCVLCGYPDIRALTIDHINGGGSAHRRKIKRSGYTFYYWLRQQGYPEGYRTLCMNCQFIQRDTQGTVSL